MNTLYQLTLKQVASSTLPVSPLPEDVAQDVMRIRYSKVMEQMIQPHNTKWIDECFSSDHEVTYTDNRDSFRKYQMAIFHGSNDCLYDAFKPSLDDIHAMIWRLIGYNPVRKVLKRKKLNLSQSPLFKICLKNITSMDYITRADVLGRYVLDQLNQ